MSVENYYKVGGSLEYQHPTYVVRKADSDLYEGLNNGEFCYVLNSRQMGKSSLRVQMMKKLKEQGVKCASIDMTRIGSHVTPAEWYAGVISELLRGFSLSRKINFSSWWREREALPPLQRLRELIEDVLLAEFSQKLVIFIDEIDSVIKIKFKEDFFAFIRACYNQRVDNPEYNRLTFCLLGVATPSDLIEDKNISTPFNIGRAIELSGFQLYEVQPLVQGLEGKVSNPEAALREVLKWTGGQPFLTQKLCKLILCWEKSISEGTEADCIAELVRSRIIENWETQDEPEHLRTIRDRLLWSQRKEQLLRLYQQILQQGEVKANDKPEHMELRLSGLVVKQQGKLRVYNRIYASVFNQNWIENTLVEAGLLPEVTKTLDDKTSQTIPTETNQFPKAPEPPPPSNYGSKAQVRKLAAKSLVAVLGEILTRQGDIEKAVAAYAEAQKLDPSIEIPASVGNNLCRWGSLWGRAAEVMEACETAVVLEPDNGKFRDSRGLARALTGNIAGAIADFQAFVDWTDSEKEKLQRQHWINVLQAGENPFTEEEIESLFNGYNVAHPEELEQVKVRRNQITFIEAGKNPAGDVEGSTLNETISKKIASPSSRPVICDRLNSDYGVDYTRLHDLLSAGQWLEADLETTAIMLKVSGREAEGWLREEDIQKFPCTDLLTIDQLWVKYSNGHFGFSVQKEIWQRVGGTKNADFKTYRSFSKHLGWDNGSNSWLRYSDLTFNTTAPVGHLPGGVLDWLWSSYRESQINLLDAQVSLHDESVDRAVLCAWWNIISSIASKLAECNIPYPTQATVAPRRLVTTVSNESTEGFIGEFLIHNKLVRIYQGDITNLVTDVIVSSDDNYLMMGGGVSQRIRRIGGDAIYRQAKNLTPLSLGEVAVTTAGKLQAKKVFHSVVIDFDDKEETSNEVIRRLVHTCMKKANIYKFRSIAFPLLGTGAGHFPVKVAWEIMLGQIISDLSDKNQNIVEVIVSIYDMKLIEDLKIKTFLEAIEKCGWKSLL